MVIQNSDLAHLTRYKPTLSICIRHFFCTPNGAFATQNLDFAPKLGICKPKFGYCTPNLALAPEFWGFAPKSRHLPLNVVTLHIKLGICLENFGIGTPNKTRKAILSCTHLFFFLSRQDVINYMMHQTQSADEDLALEACEFWSAIAEMEVCSLCWVKYFMIAFEIPAWSKITPSGIYPRLPDISFDSSLFLRNLGEIDFWPQSGQKWQRSLQHCFGA